MKKAPGWIYPHAEAVAAMYLWADEYGQDTCSAMEFHERLCEARKRLCKDLIDDIFAPDRKRASSLTSQDRQT